MTVEDQQWEFVHLSVVQNGSEWVKLGVTVVLQITDLITPVFLPNISKSLSVVYTTLSVSR